MNFQLIPEYYKFTSLKSLYEFMKSSKHLILKCLTNIYMKELAYLTEGNSNELSNKILKFCLQLNVDKEHKELIESHWWELLLLLLRSDAFKNLNTIDFPEGLFDRLSRINLEELLLEKSEYMFNSALDLDDLLSVSEILILASFDLPNIKRFISFQLTNNSSRIKEKYQLKNLYEDKLNKRQALEIALNKYEMGNSELLEKLDIKLNTDTNISKGGPMDSLEQENDSDKGKEKPIGIQEKAEQTKQYVQKLNSKLESIKSKYYEISNKIAFKKLLGKDFAKNHYYKFPFLEDEIFVYMKTTWKIVPLANYGKLYNRLQEKGRLENELRRSIKVFVNNQLDDKFSNAKMQINSGTVKQTPIQIEENEKEMTDANEEALDRAIQNQAIKDLLLRLTNELFQCGDKMTKYLITYSKEWETFQTREKIVMILT